MSDVLAKEWTITKPDTMDLIDYLGDYLCTLGIAPNEYPGHIVIQPVDACIQLPLDGDTGGMVDLGDPIGERDFIVEKIIYDKSGDLLISLEWG